VGVKRLLLPLSVLATVGLLFSSVQPAAACSCGSSPIPDLQADTADLVGVGVVEDIEFDGVDEIADKLAPGDGRSGPWLAASARIIVRIDHHLKGPREGRIEIESNWVEIFKGSDGRLIIDLFAGPNCAIFEKASIGRRYLLFLHERGEGGYDTSVCSGSNILRPHPDPGVHPEVNAYWDERLRGLDTALGLPPGTLVAIANNAPLPSEPSFPLLPAAVAATLGPLAFLAGAAFVWRGKGGAA
jgi:hypothetical protein